MPQTTPFQPFDPIKKIFSGLNTGFGSIPQTNNQTTQMSSPATPSLNYTPANYTPAPTVNQPANSLNYTPVNGPMTPATPPMTQAPVAPNIPAPTGPSNYTVRGGDTLSAIARQNNMSLKDLLALNPQFQANPNLIRPGDSVTLREGQNYTADPMAGQYFTQDPSQAFTPVPQADQINYSQPLNYTPVPTGQTYPNTPVAPSTYSSTPKTSTGQTINTSTGGIVETPPIPATSTYGASTASASTSAPGPSSSMSTTAPASGYNSAMSNYENNLQLTPEELAVQEEINRLEESRRKAYTGEGQRAIPLEFITGRQNAIEQRALDLSAPLQSKAALLQAKRTAALEASKFRVGVEEAKLAREDEAKKPISGTSFYDPTSKSFIQAPVSGADAFTLGSGQARYDAAGNLIATNIGTGGVDATNDYKNWQLAGEESGTGLTFAEWQGKTKPGEQSDYLQRVGQQAIDSVDELLPQISGNTTGWQAFFKGKLPTSEARSFAAQLDTLKSNITFGSLVAMREASKTGGALGQVSDKEGQLLQSSLGALDQLQSADQLKAQLNKIKASIERWNTAVEASGGSGGGAEDGGFNW